MQRERERAEKAEKGQEVADTNPEAGRARGDEVAEQPKPALPMEATPPPNGQPGKNV